MTWMEFLTQYGGAIFGYLGVALAVVFSGFGSSYGTGGTGSAAASLIKDQPEKFTQALILFRTSPSFAMRLSPSGSLYTTASFFPTPRRRRSTTP